MGILQAHFFIIQYLVGVVVDGVLVEMCMTDSIIVRQYCMKNVCEKYSKKKSDSFHIFKRNFPLKYFL